MKKFVAIAAAGAIAVAASLAVTAPSQAFHPHYGPGPAIGAGIFGFVAGAALANAYHDHWYRGGSYGGPGWEDHVAACASTYRTYSPRDDAYTASFDRYGSPIRVPCQL